MAVFCRWMPRYGDEPTKGFWIEWHLNLCKWFERKVIWTEKASLAIEAVQTLRTPWQGGQDVPFVSSGDVASTAASGPVFRRAARPAAYPGSPWPGKLALARLGLLSRGHRLGIPFPLPDSGSRVS